MCLGITSPFILASLVRAQNIFMPANINSVILLLYYILTQGATVIGYAVVACCLCIFLVMFWNLDEVE